MAKAADTVLQLPAVRPLRERLRGSRLMPAVRWQPRLRGLLPEEQAAVHQLPREPCVHFLEVPCAPCIHFGRPTKCLRTEPPQGHPGGIYARPASSIKSVYTVDSISLWYKFLQLYALFLE
ncbi:hypothetical protein V5799_011351 [Amblyomma americanum]|uniref:Uncharacterized protein n=1 Tax=Amblyomma americanum TaxID=6943 RepID=A0AAQ4EH48_AMBAM